MTGEWPGLGGKGKREEADIAELGQRLGLGVRVLRAMKVGSSGDPRKKELLYNAQGAIS